MKIIINLVNYIQFNVQGFNKSNIARFSIKFKHHNNLAYIINANIIDKFFFIYYCKYYYLLKLEFSDFSLFEF